MLCLASFWAAKGTGSAKALKDLMARARTNYPQGSRLGQKIIKILHLHYPYQARASLAPEREQQPPVPLPAAGSYGR
jgi:hypothetical protein